MKEAIITIGSEGVFEREVRGKYSHDDDQVELHAGNIWEDTENFEDFVVGLNVIFLTELLCVSYHGNIETSAELTCYATEFWGNRCFFFNGAKRACDSEYNLKIDKR